MSMNKQLLEKIYFRAMVDLYKKGDSRLSWGNLIDCYEKSSRPEKMTAFLETVREKAIHNPHFRSFKATFVRWNGDDLNYRLYIDQELHIMVFTSDKWLRLRYWEKDIPHAPMTELHVSGLNIDWWILNVHE